MRSSRACDLAHWKALQTSDSASIGVVVSFDSRYSMEMATMPRLANRRAETNTQSGSPSLHPPP